MAEEKRRFGDTFMGRLSAMWPVLLALILLFSSYIRNDKALADTVELAKETAGKVSLLERNLAVQNALLEEIRTAVREISRRGR